MLKQCGHSARKSSDVWAGILMLSLLTISASERVSAADFRALNFDDACEGVQAREATLGSKPFDGKLPSGYEFAFVSRELDRDVVVGYACRAGKFYRGAYIFDARDESDAAKLYSQLKRRTTREMGTPYYDFASNEHRRKMHELGATLSRADTQVAFWKNARYEAHASVAEPGKDRGWRVSLSYTALSALDE